jgi:hypothetical protein
MGSRFEASHATRSSRPFPLRDVPLTRDFAMLQSPKTSLATTKAPARKIEPPHRLRHRFRTVKEENGGGARGSMTFFLDILSRNAYRP